MGKTMAMDEAQNPQPFDMVQWMRTAFANIDEGMIIDGNLESWISVFRKARLAFYSISSLRDRHRRNAASWHVP